MATTTTRSRSRTKTTTPSTEGIIVEQDVTVEQTAEELRRQVANADQAIKSLDLRIADAEALMQTAHKAVEDILDAQNARRLHIQALQEEDGRLSLEIDDMRVDVAITESGTTVRGMKKRADRRLEIKTEIRQATAEDTKLRKAEAVELAQIEAGNQVVEAERNQLLVQRATFEGKRAAIFERLGQALYTEGGAKLDELARSRRGASLDEKHYQEEETKARQALKLELAPWYSLRDSGSHEHGSSFQIVAMEKEFQTGIMHKQRFGERERFANKATQPLSQRVIPSLHMRRFSRFFSDCCMLFFWNHRLVSFPKIRVTMPFTIGLGNGFPQHLTCFLTSISHCVCDNLTRLATQCYPYPCLIRLLEHK